MTEERQLIKDYSDEVKELIPSYLDPVKQNPAKVPFALENLLSLEKKTRLAADGPSTRKVALAIIDLLFEIQDWSALNDHIALLCKRRAQLKQVILAVVKRGYEIVTEFKEKSIRLMLIETLREVSAGKIFVELERARLTRILAEMKESEGNISQASDILQEVQVETVGSMEKREKAEFLIEQVRLTLEKQDWIRSELVAKKVNRKVLSEDGFLDLKLKFYHLMIRYHRHFGEYLEVSKAYSEIYRSSDIQSDAEKWKPALNNAVIYLVLAPHDPEQNDLMVRFKQDKKISELPQAQSALELFTAQEIIPRPIPQEIEWSSMEAFQGEYGLKAKADLHKRINEHNIRIISQYYTRIRFTRLAELLKLDPDTTETYLSEMVSEGQLVAKIDRPTGIVSFAAEVKKNTNTMMNEWAGNISELLNLVEKTCHLINKEKMVHGF